MLKQRVITALILLAVLIAALTLAAPWGFPALVAVFVGAALWEWLRLVGMKPRAALLTALGVMLVIGVLIESAIERVGLKAVIGSGPAGSLIGLAVVVWFFLSLRLFVTGKFLPVASERVVHGAVGVVLLGACGLALVAAYQRGLVFMMSIMVLVWAADIAAYFTGRAFGRRKLAPAISPGKTWEGALGGLVAVWLLGALSAWLTVWTPLLDATLFARMANAWSPALVVLTLLALTALSIVGDLFESNLKRQAGVKDSSNLLPGHGGVLDRIDALLPVVPAVMLISHWF